MYLYIDNTSSIKWIWKLIFNCMLFDSEHFTWCQTTALYCHECWEFMCIICRHTI